MAFGHEARAGLEIREPGTGFAARSATADAGFKPAAVDVARMRAGVGVAFGKDSSQYEMAGGTREGEG